MVKGTFLYTRRLIDDQNFSSLGAPRVLEVLLELVHPDRVVHLPLVRVQAAAGGGEAGPHTNSHAHDDDHHHHHDEDRKDGSDGWQKRKTVSHRSMLVTDNVGEEVLEIGKL